MTTFKLFASFLIIVSGFALNAQTCTYNSGSMTFTGTCTDGAFTDLVFPNNSNSVDATQFQDLTGVTIKLGSNSSPTFSSTAETDSGTNFDFNSATTNVIVRFGNGSNLTYSKHGDPSIGDLNVALSDCDATCTLGGAGLVLPVALTRFDAERIGKSVKLSWFTASETNNDFFTPERSVDGLNWEALSSVFGAGSSQATSEYVAYDEAPLPGISYYRIKQTDYDGRFSYSPLRNIEVVATDFAFPNPTSGPLTITGGGIVTVSDLAGRQLLTTTGHDGVNVTTLDLSDLRPGMYLVRTDAGIQKVLRH